MKNKFIDVHIDYKWSKVVKIITKRLYFYYMQILLSVGNKTKEISDWDFFQTLNILVCFIT